MEIQYGNNKIEKQLSTAAEIKKAFGQMAVKVSLRIAEIRSSDTLAVLQTIPGACCHPLVGDQQGKWAVKISPNHRLVFRIANSPIPRREDGSINTSLITIVEIIGSEDYH